MDFSWTEEQIQFREKIVKFAQQELQSNLIDLDWREEFNRESWEKCGKFGLIGLPIPEHYGGTGTDILTTICALEALGYGCKDNGLIFAINAHIWAGEIPILTFGTEAQKQKYLPKLCSGEFIGAHGASEPEAGSDIYNLKTTAKIQGDKYILNGVKNWVTNGPVADLYIVFANVAPEKGKRGITGFIVEKDFAGVAINRKISKMGLRTTQLGELFLENCEVPSENRLGQEGSGLAIFNHSMEWERGFILASAIGTMERLLESCIQYARKRQQFGQSIGKFQLVSSKIVDMKMRLETARALLYKVGWLKNNKKTAIMEAAMAKLYISESWVQSCLDAIQIHGGYGYLTELELERELRDALGSKLYSGTSEIQYQIIAQFMGL
ncbi:L-prolyl-[peptidyl-carrier protein] dehydrogenase [Planktothrix tepida]|uniref:Acyl-CoA dehydrogenase n=2 Tax=Planktothrix TaxID=54304 RepID=A0A1J1LP07_9CYAN|nr:MULTISPECIES: acyl-CoA dehydrogenase family protein [Planktothrix]CAD5954792.1 L-prolyl-[peptidyl-carrier protein] dehydrogenase [Planktothrix pseudagardhii]CAD5955712.1 L-prolyl-[peptidyl-carrier protein] dehydrogenase [Planktothrix tepida]CUR34151.1 acyl-CoA dehydrogenase [Planktothrix tepida PCC 9214]